MLLLILAIVGGFNAVVIAAMVIYWRWAVRQDIKMVRAAMPGLQREIETELANQPVVEATPKDPIDEGSQTNT